MTIENNVPSTLTFGEIAVGHSFNPSGNPVVADIKAKAAAFIDACHDLRSAGTQEQARMASIAITEAQTAQMWAVKAATWE